MDAKKKKKTIYISIGILITLCIVLFAAKTYAEWIDTQKQTNVNKIIAACVDVSYTNETADIVMNNAYPITNAEGLATEGYSFTLTNNCDAPVTYVVALEEVDDGTKTELLNDNYINISIDDNYPSIVGTLQNVDDDLTASYSIIKTKGVAIRQLAAHEQVTHTIKMWLDSSTPYSEQNKKFVSKVRIVGGQGIEEYCYTVDNNGVLTKYNEKCGKYAIIPASVDGKNVVTIDSEAFKKQVATNYNKGYEGNTDKIWDESNNWTLKEDEVTFSLVYISGNYTKMANRYKVVWDNTDPYIEAGLLPYAVIYDKDSYYEENQWEYRPIDYLTDEYEIGAFFKDGQPVPFNIYLHGNEPSQERGVYEVFYKCNFSSSVQCSEVGYREADTFKKTLNVESVDFSVANNLLNIEDFAFTNAPDTVTNYAYYPDWNSVEYGLKKAKFEGNTNPINIGLGAFAKADLDELTIYTNYNVYSSNNYIPSITNVNYQWSILPFKNANLGDVSIKDSGNHEFMSSVSFINNVGGLRSYGILAASTVDSATLENGITDIESVNLSFEFSELNMPNSVTTIKRTVSTIDQNTYGYTDSQTYLNRRSKGLHISNNLSNIITGFFKNYTGASDESLTVPASFGTIENNMFGNFSGSSLTVSNGITSIGDYAFSAFNGSGTFSLGNSVQTIGRQAFDHYVGTGPITLPSSLTSIGYAAFDYYGLNVSSGWTITIPAGVTSIDSQAFSSFTGTIQVYSDDLLSSANMWAHGANVVKIN